MRLFGGDRIQNMMEKFDLDEDTPIENKMLTRAIENAQTTVESRNFQSRKSALEYDDVMNKQREIIYAQRRQVLDRLVEGEFVIGEQIVSGFLFEGDERKIRILLQKFPHGRRDGSSVKHTAGETVDQKRGNL